MAHFKVSCPVCKVRLKRIGIVDFNQPIEKITWLYSCRSCCKGWVYHPFTKQVTQYQPPGAPTSVPSSKSF